MLRRSDYGYSAGIVELDGPDSLCNAAEELFANPGTALVVIRNLIDSSQLCEPDNPKVDVSNYAAYHNKYRPESFLGNTAALDSVVQKLSSQHFPRLHLLSGTIQLTTIRHEPIKPHVDHGDPVDGGYYGPLTLSLRVDNNTRASRVFLAKRPNFPVDHQDINARLKHKMQLKREVQKSRRRPQNFASVEQRPGDGVMYINYPYLTIHGVDAEPGQTLAALYDYRSVTVY